jgi:NADH:ubiquinone oxidoreductase subunit E
MFTLDALRCIGACALAPALSVNGKVYPKVTPDQVERIINEYRNMEAAE